MLGCRPFALRRAGRRNRPVCETAPFLIPGRPAGGHWSHLGEASIQWAEGDDIPFLAYVEAWFYLGLVTIC